MKLLPIGLALIVAAVAIWRRRQMSRPLKAVAVILLVCLVAVGSGLLRLPELETVVRTLGSVLGPCTYVLVAVMAFLETAAFVGLVVPGEAVVVVGGAVAGQGHIDLALLLGVTWACALAGDMTGYTIGRRLGRAFLGKHGHLFQLTEPRLARVEHFFARYGPTAIVVGRFVGLVRPLAPFLAGASRYPARRFSALALLGTGLWSVAFVLLGFLCWQSLDEAIAIAKQGGAGITAAVLLVTCLIAGIRYSRRRPLRGRGSTRLKRSHSRRGNVASSERSS